MPGDEQVFWRVMLLDGVQRAKQLFRREGANVGPISGIVWPNRAHRHDSGVMVRQPVRWDKSFCDTSTGESCVTDVVFGEQRFRVLNAVSQPPPSPFRPITAMRPEAAIDEGD